MLIDLVVEVFVFHPSSAAEEVDPDACISVGNRRVQKGHRTGRNQVHRVGWEVAQRLMAIQ